VTGNRLHLDTLHCTQDSDMISDDKPTLIIDGF